MAAGQLQLSAVRAMHWAQRKAAAAQRHRAEQVNSCRSVQVLVAGHLDTPWTVLAYPKKQPPGIGADAADTFSMQAPDATDVIATQQAGLGTDVLFQRSMQ